MKIYLAAVTIGIVAGALLNPSGFWATVKLIFSLLAGS